MVADVAIIGGTGIGVRLLELPGRPVHVPTEFGMVRTRLVTHAGVRIAVLSRHSAGHKVPPHSVNYRGLASACRELKVRACLATAAVGSLRPDWPEQTLVVCAQMIDLAARNLTLFDRVVEHRDITHPFAPALQARLHACFPEAMADGVYANLNGPRYETGAEIQALRTLGASLVGMTAGSEAIAFREAGVPYACLAIVTNLAAGIAAGELGHGEVVDVMKVVGPRVVDGLLSLASEFSA